MTEESKSIKRKMIHIVGFGSQGSAWAQCLQKSGWQVQVYLPKQSLSFRKVSELGIKSFLIQDLSQEISSTDHIHWIALLCPDSFIPTIYDEFIAPVDSEVRLILAHGFAVYSQELKLMNSKHQTALLAPKAIGPKLLQHFNENFPSHHSLVAAFNPPLHEESELIAIAHSLGFHESSLVQATFEQEAIGDLISEQSLLCGGVLNLLLITMEEMAKAGVPERLIREECITELELIAGLIRDRGPAKTFEAISQAAQCGTIAMGNLLEQARIRELISQQAESIRNRQFVTYFNSAQWKDSAKTLNHLFVDWEKKFARTSKPQETK